EDFKFSAAHFTLFPDGSAELLHGHNYQVAVEVEGGSLNELGLLCDFAALKTEIRRCCARMDSRTLIPLRSSELVVRTEDGSVDVTYRDRHYRLPLRDVLLLELTNTTIELLAAMLWQELAPHLEGSRVRELGVSVAETAGQSCWYRAPLPETSGG
ncbi:MAG: 6-carboxytetrahydropterin synthase, partial [Acidobacteria bacterium]|nr:6-carboxytetrahydropterin synthase [Acidobacteriota bacterium]